VSAYVSRPIVFAAALTLLAGCNTQKTLETTDNKSAAAAPTDTMPVVEGTCPQIFLRDGTSSYRTYAKGGKDDPAKVIYQASLAETSRSCTMNASAMNITVVAQGRLVTGPVGSAGNLVMPIRVAVTDGQTTLYSELVKFEAAIPAGGSSAQFVFRKDNVSIPGGAGKLAKIYIGFDEGPYNTK